MIGCRPARGLRRWAAWAALACGVAALGCTAAETDPGKPDMAATASPPLQVEVRLWAAGFADHVEHAADRIAAAGDDPALRLAALRWKLGVSEAVMRAGLRPPAALALVDTWTLARQNLHWVETAGATAFGPQHGIALEAASTLAAEAESMALRRLPPPAYAAYRQLVDTHAAANPITDAGFSRTPITLDWLRVAAQVGGLSGELRSVTRSAPDLVDRGLELLHRLPAWLRWRAESAASDHLGVWEEARRVLGHLDRGLAPAAPAQAGDPPTPAPLQRLYGLMREDVEQLWSRTRDTVRIERDTMWARLRDTPLVRQVLTGVAVLLGAVLATGFALGWVAGRWLAARRDRALAPALPGTASGRTRPQG